MSQGGRFACLTEVAGKGPQERFQPLDRVGRLLPVGVGPGPDQPKPDPGGSSGVHPRHATRPHAPSRPGCGTSPRDGSSHHPVQRGFPGCQQQFERLSPPPSPHPPPRQGPQCHPICCDCAAQAVQSGRLQAGVRSAFLQQLLLQATASIRKSDSRQALLPQPR